MGSHFGVGAPPILVYFSGDWDVQAAGPTSDCGGPIWTHMAGSDRIAKARPCGNNVFPAEASWMKRRAIPALVVF